MCGIVPIKLLLHTEFHDKKLHHGSREDGIMLRNGLSNSDVEVVVIDDIGCSSLDMSAPLLPREILLPRDENAQRARWSAGIVAAGCNYCEVRKETPLPSDDKDTHQARQSKGKAWL